MKYLYAIIIALVLNNTPLLAQQPDTAPVYPGCEQATEKMTCFKEHLLNFMVENFDSDLLKKVKDARQVNMMISFVINEEGKLEDIEVKSGYEFLNDEMKKVLAKIPAIQPARKDGQPIPMRYELPVVFEVSE